MAAQTNHILSRFIAASGLTNLADGIATVVWAWMATLLTRDPILVALVPVALRVPWVVCALPAGVVTDRVDRRVLILAMDVLRAVAFAVVAVVIYAGLPAAPPPEIGVLSWSVFFTILGAALVVGTAEVFRDNAAQTMLPTIVPHNTLEQANGRLWSVELVGNALLGPALGAFLIGYAASLPFVLNAVIYLLAVALLLRLQGHFKPAFRNQSNWRADIKEALQFLLAAPLLRALAWITGLWNLFFEMVMIALVLHVQENLSLEAQSYGLILAAGALGGILGGWVGDRIVRQFGPMRTAQWMLAASPPCFLAIFFAPGPVSLAIVLMMFNFTGLVWNTVSVSYRQRSIPDALLGRVNSLYRLLAWGMMPIGLMLSGLIVGAADGILARDLALTVPFLVAMLGSGLLAIAGWRALSRGFSGPS